MRMLELLISALAALRQFGLLLPGLSDLHQNVFVLRSGSFSQPLTIRSVLPVFFRIIDWHRVTSMMGRHASGTKFTNPQSCEAGTPTRRSRWRCKLVWGG